MLIGTLGAAKLAGRRVWQDRSGKGQGGKALFVPIARAATTRGLTRWTEPNKYGKRFILVGVVPQTYVGTDRTQFEALRSFAITGDLSKFLPPEFRGKPMLPPFIFSLCLGGGSGNGDSEAQAE